MGIDELIRTLKSAVEVPGLNVGTSSEPHTELVRVLCEAAGGVRDVPPGWAELRREAERMLQSAMASVASRRELRVSASYVLGRQPVLRLSGRDPVVHGIYRRTLARARHTCQSCGRAGRAWECLSQFRVLCARCAAPHAVAADLDAVEALRERLRRSTQDTNSVELPARLAGLIGAVLTTGAPGCANGSARCSALGRATSRDEFERWCGWLLDLRSNPAFADALNSVQ